MKRATNDKVGIEMDKAVLVAMPYNASVRKKLLEHYNECLDLSLTKKWFIEQLHIHDDWKLKQEVIKEQMKANEIGIQD